MPISSPEPKPKLTEKGFLQYAGMGMQLLGIIVIFTIVGRYLDIWLEWKFPVFTLVFSLTGVTMGMYSFIRKL